MVAAGDRNNTVFGRQVNGQYNYYRYLCIVYLLEISMPFVINCLFFSGVFGLLITIIFLVIFYFIKVDSNQWGQGPDNRLEDFIDGFIQIGNNYQGSLQ